MTSRRGLLSFVGVAALAAAVTAGAQTNTALPRVAVVVNTTEQQSQPFKASFLEGMRQVGQVDGRTFQLDTRYGNGDPARIAALIRESVATRPAVLVVTGLIAARLARDATSIVPVVVATSSDLVDAGIVKSHAHPGGNITGVSDLADETAVKRLELLKAALPDASRVALLVNPEFPAASKIERRVQSAAEAMRITVTRVDASDRASLALAVDSLVKTRPDALLVADSVAVQNAGELIDRATAIRKTANALGLKIPQSLLVRADEVI